MALWTKPYGVRTIGFMALDLWSQDYFKRFFYVIIKSFLWRFFIEKVTQLYIEKGSKIRNAI
jgi:hypothetical protein